MFKVPLQDIINQIKDKKGLSEEDINWRIDDKLKQLSGLISREGAAHIIANELGVKVFEQFTGKLKIAKILSGMRSVETVGKVMRCFELREFQTQKGPGKVASLVIGDDSGTMRVAMWGEQAENIYKVKEGDIVKVENAYVRDNQGRLELHLNDRSRLVINPPGEQVDVVKQDFQPQQQAKRVKLNELQEGMDNVEIFGTITQTFDPRFYPVCPECNKKPKQDGDNFFCDTHSQITPDYSYVLNLFLDDGTENIRCVFFKNQADRLLDGKDLLKYKDAPQDFEQVKTELLGNQVKLVGRVTKNQMFDRLEFIAQLVLDADPQQEIDRLQEQ